MLPKIGENFTATLPISAEHSRDLLTVLEELEDSPSFLAPFLFYCFRRSFVSSLTFLRGVRFAVLKLRPSSCGPFMEACLFHQLAWMPHLLAEETEGNLLFCTGGCLTSPQQYAVEVVFRLQKKDYFLCLLILRCTTNRLASLALALFCLITLVLTRIDFLSPYTTFPSNFDFAGNPHDVSGWCNSN